MRIHMHDGNLFIVLRVCARVCVCVVVFVCCVYTFACYDVVARVCVCDVVVS